VAKDPTGRSMVVTVSVVCSLRIWIADMDCSSIAFSLESSTSLGRLRCSLESFAGIGGLSTRKSNIIIIQ
jgi:hypothetical protein